MSGLPTSPSNHNELLAFVLEASSTLPVGRRVRVLRGLAEVVGSSREQNQLNSLANDLETADRHLLEFSFNFNKNP